MKIGAKQMLNVLYVISWIIFIGVSIEAGAFIFQAILSLKLDAENVKKIWQQVDLMALLQYDHGHFIAMMLLMIIVSILRATIFYQIIRILHDKKLDIVKPFNMDMVRFLVTTSCLSLMIAFFSWYGRQYAEWMVAAGVKMPDIEHLRLGGADVWAFMGVALLVIAQIFKRGIEIQSENDLTV
jgi:hypothetical protein